MPTQRELDDTAAEYRRASDFVHQAQKLILATHHVAQRVTGTYGPTSPPEIFEAMTELLRNLSHAYVAISTAKPDPGQ